MSTRFVKVGSSVEAWSLIRSLVAPVVAERGVCIRSARAWDALRQEVRRQLQEHDARRGCGVDPWEVA